MNPVFYRRSLSAEGWVRMNVRSVIDEIQARVERANSASSASFTTPSASSADAGRLVSLRAAYRRLYEARDLVGQMPLSPPTLRAKVGGSLVRIVQRMLFWYTPQILRFQREATTLMSSACDLIERQFELIGALQNDIGALRSERSSPSTGFQGPSSNQSQSLREDALPESFEFALQDHFRGSEGDAAGKLRIWLEEIAAAGSPTSGSWMDVGCGRGEWLALASGSGHNVFGIDSSAVSIDYCRARSLQVENAQALDYLARVPDNSLAVVTAFHVVEHFPTSYFIEFVRLAVRKLQTGGILALETPNPANILMGAHYFWNDPTHRRPIPPALMEFVFSYFGLNIVKRLELNPFPRELQLPYAEIDLVRRVNDHFYGPRDYGLIGRK
jgi:SAM-dependent methyltransferase